jgi:hypothetical protein
MKKLLFLIPILFAVCACAPKNIPAVHLMPKNIDLMESPVTNSSLGNIDVKIDPDGDIDSYINCDNFKIALTETLKRANCFGESENDKINISAEVYKATFPNAGFQMESELGVRYDFYNGHGEKLFTEDIFYKGIAKPTESFLGSARALMAFQRANQEHMDLLLSKIREDFENTK